MWCNGLSLEDWQEKIATEDDCMYLHGFCNEWVHNNYQDGDKILIIVALDWDYDFDHIVHCCLIRNDMYIDVRGETDSLDDVLDGFDDYDSEYSDDYVLENLNDFIVEMKGLGVCNA